MPRCLSSIVPPGAVYSLFVMDDAVWHGGLLSSWCTMGSGLLSAIRYLLAGQFPSPQQTLDCCESIVRYVISFHRSEIMQTDTGQ